MWRRPSRIASVGPTFAATEGAQGLAGMPCRPAHGLTTGLQQPRLPLIAIVRLAEMLLTGWRPSCRTPAKNLAGLRRV